MARPVALGEIVTDTKEDTVEEIEGEPDTEKDDDTDGDTVLTTEALKLDEGVPDADTVIDSVAVSEAT